MKFSPTRQPHRGPGTPSLLREGISEGSYVPHSGYWLYNARGEPRSSALITHPGDSDAAALQDWVPPALSTGHHTQSAPWKDSTLLLLGDSTIDSYTFLASRPEFIWVRTNE